MLLHAFMSKSATPPISLTMEEKLRRAQEAYRELYLQCFWSAPEDLVITEETLQVVIDGLKLDGGHKGWRLAHTPCR
jgi:hypothetical protein